jgi:integrase
MSERLPKYRKHKQSGQAIVTLTDGLGGRRDVLLGKHGTAASKREYERVVSEWLAGGRRLPGSASGDLTVNQLIAAFWPHVEKHYRRPDGTPTKEVSDQKLSLRPLKHLYGHSPARDFGPLALKAVRQLLVTGYTHPKYGEQPALARSVVNQRVGRIRRMFRWAVEEELVPPSVYHGLLAVRGLQRGRTEARETEEVRPVSRAVVGDTLPLLRPTVADMVLLQLETGMRSGELVIMRGLDLDTSGKVWLYRPGSDQGQHGAHKTAHHGFSRVIAVGPKGQEIIRRHLKTDTQAYLFSPADSVAEFRARQRQARKTKVQPSQQNRRKHNPDKRPGERYTASAYARAIADAIKRWNKKKPEAEHIPHWHPHQLRHTRATEVRKEYGLDAARAVLGHHSPIITETYAELDEARAAEVMGRIG